MVTGRLPVTVWPVIGLLPIDQPVGLLVAAGASSVIDVSDRPGMSLTVAKLVAVAVAKITTSLTVAAPGRSLLPLPPLQLLAEPQFWLPPTPFHVNVVWALA